jgi:hypothetical protein
MSTPPITPGDSIASASEMVQLEESALPNSGVLTGVEVVPVAKPAGLFQTTLTNIANYILGLLANGTAALESVLIPAQAGAPFIDMHTAPPTAITAMAGSPVFSYYPVIGNDPGNHQLAQQYTKFTPSQNGSISEVGLAIDSLASVGYVPSWTVSTNYAAGVLVQANSYVWQASIGGISAATGTGPAAPGGPSAGLVPGTTVVDGTVTWVVQSHNESDFKPLFFFTQEIAPGAGSAWIGSMDQVLASGWQGQNGYVLELDQTNDRGHAAPDGNFTAANLFTYGYTQYRNTASVLIGTPSSTPNTGAHAYGILMNDGGSGGTGKLNYYSDISLNTSAQVAIDINPISGIGAARSIAGIRFNDVSPAADAIQIGGSHKNGININGTIGQWAIVSNGFTVDSSGDVGAATINSSTGTVNANGNYGRLNLLTANNMGWRLISNANGSTMGSAVLQGTTDGFNASFINALTAQTTGQVSLGAGIASTSNTTGTLVVTGGVGVSGAVYTGGNVDIAAVGSGLRVAEGSNAKQGVVTLAGTTTVVSNTSVTANSRIQLTGQADGGTPGWIRVSTRTAGTSFTITSSSSSDASVVAYEIFEPG